MMIQFGQYLCVTFLLFNIMFLRSAHSVVSISSLFLSLAGDGMNRPLFVFPSSYHGYLGQFQFLVIINKAVRNILMQIFLWAYVLLLGKYSGVGFLDPRVFVRHCQALSQTDCTVLYSRQQCKQVLVTPHACQCLLVSVKFQPFRWVCIIVDHTLFIIRKNCLMKK